MIQEVISKLQATKVSTNNKVLLSHTDAFVVVTVFTGPDTVFSILVKDAELLDGITVDTAPNTKAKLDEAAASVVAP